MKFRSRSSRRRWREHENLYLISGDAGEDSFDETAKEEEEYRLSSIMPMEEVRERVKKMIAEDGYYHR